MSDSGTNQFVTSNTNIFLPNSVNVDIGRSNVTTLLTSQVQPQGASILTHERLPWAVCSSNCLQASFGVLGLPPKAKKRETGPTTHKSGASFPIGSLVLPCSGNVTIGRSNLEAPTDNTVRHTAPQLGASVSTQAPRFVLRGKQTFEPGASKNSEPPPKPKPEPRTPDEEVRLDREPLACSTNTRLGHSTTRSLGHPLTRIRRHLGTRRLRHPQTLGHFLSLSFSFSLPVRVQSSESSGTKHAADGSRRGQDSVLHWFSYTATFPSSRASVGIPSCDSVTSCHSPTFAQTLYLCVSVHLCTSLCISVYLCVSLSSVYVGSVYLFMKHSGPIIGPQSPI